MKTISSSTTKTILLLDRDFNSRRVLRRQLIEMGCEVDETGDPDTAFHLCSRKDYDLLCFHVTGPLVTSLGFLHQIRRYDPELPIVVLSAFSSAENVATAYRLGVKDFVERPCDRATLEERVGRCLA